MLYHNPTHKPLLEQKPLPAGHNRRETFAEPSNCSANTHCKQTLQKSSQTPIFPRELGAVVIFRTLTNILIVNHHNNNHFFLLFGGFFRGWPAGGRDCGF
jgi:hypothetical protein